MRMQVVIGVRRLVSGLISRGDGRRMRESEAVPRRNERGIALISVLLIMSLLLMLGLAVTFTSVSDKFITSNYKNMMSGFYAAEAGVNNLNRVLRTDEFVLASIPTPPVIVPGSPTLNRDAFIVTAEKLLNKREDFPNPCLLYTSPSPRDRQKSRMPSSA